MPDYTSKIQELGQYLKGLGDEQQRVIGAANDAAASTRNPRVARMYKEAAQRQLAQLKTYGDQANKERIRLSKLVEAANKPNAAGQTAQQKLEAQAAAQKPQADLAKSREEQAKQFNASSAELIPGAGGKGFLDLMKTGSGVPNYPVKLTDQKDANGQYIPYRDAQGNTVRISDRPYSVTMAVPKDKNDPDDKQAIADEKARLLSRKDLDKDVAASFQSLTGKAPTAEAIFGPGGIQMDPKTGKILKNNTGFIFAGTPEAYYDLQKRYNESQKQEKENSRFNSVDVPADTYQSLVGKANELQDPSLPPVQSAIDKDMLARAKVANPGTVDINAPTMSLPGPTNVPIVGRTPDGAVRTIGALEKWTRGQPVAGLNMGDTTPLIAPKPPPYVDEPSATDLFDDQNRLNLQRLTAQSARNVADSDLLATNQGAPALRRPEVEAIMAKSADPRVSTNAFEQLYHEPRTLDQIKAWDPVTYGRLKAAVGGSVGEDSPLDPRAVAAAGNMLQLANPNKTPMYLGNAALGTAGNIADMADAYRKDLFDVNVPVYYPPKIEHPELAGPLGNYD